nr:putative protease Do-like 14 [Coffea arabica]
MLTFLETNGKHTSIGCGTIIRCEGNHYTVLSCEHIFNPIEKIYARSFDGGKYKVGVLFMDKQSDISTVRIVSEVPLEVATLGDSTKLLPGTMVGALGCPLGLPNTFTAGVVSSVGRKSFELQHVDFQGYLKEVIVMDIVLSNGNSGGPRINLDGEVVGVNSRGIRRFYERGLARINRLGFAIPIEYVCKMLDTVSREGSPTFPCSDIQGN